MRRSVKMILSTAHLEPVPKPQANSQADNINYQNDIIQQALECLEQRIKYQTASLDNPIEVMNYLRLQLAPELNEVFAVLFLDNVHRVLAFEKVFQGTIGQTTVHPRVIVQLA